MAWALGVHPGCGRQCIGLGLPLNFATANRCQAAGSFSASFGSLGSHDGGRRTPSSSSAHSRPSSARQGSTRLRPKASGSVTVFRKHCSSQLCPLRPERCLQTPSCVDCTLRGTRPQSPLEVSKNLGSRYAAFNSASCRSSSPDEGYGYQESVLWPQLAKRYFIEEATGLPVTGPGHSDQNRLQWVAHLLPPSVTRHRPRRR